MTGPSTARARVCAEGAPALPTLPLLLVGEALALRPGTTETGGKPAAVVPCATPCNCEPRRPPALRALPFSRMVPGAEALLERLLRVLVSLGRVERLDMRLSSKSLPSTVPCTVSTEYLLDDTGTSVCTYMRGVHVCENELYGVVCWCWCWLCSLSPYVCWTGPS